MSERRNLNAEELAEVSSFVELMRAKGKEMMVAGVPRVSDVLAPIVNYSAVPRAILENARDRGMRVAQMTDDHYAGKNPIPDEDLMGYHRSFKQWLGLPDEWDVEHSELKLGYSGDDGDLRGTTDLLQASSSAHLNLIQGSIPLRVVDFKAVYQPRPPHRIQIVLYTAMIEQLINQNVKQFPHLYTVSPILVYLQRDGTAAKVKYSRATDQEGAKALLWIHTFRWVTDSQYRNDLTRAHSYEFDAEVPTLEMIPGPIDLHERVCDHLRVPDQGDRKCYGVYEFGS